MVTVSQLKELNKKIDQLKDQNSAAIAELKVLQGQFDTKAGELSKMLNIQVTAENIEALYMQAQQQLEEKAGKIEELLSDLQGGQTNGQQNVFGQQATGPAGFSTPLQQMMPQNNFGNAQPVPPAFNPVQSQPVQPPTFTPTATQPNDGAVAPNFANFGTGTVFNI